MSILEWIVIIGFGAVLWALMIISNQLSAILRAITANTASIQG
jgi:hypothetical protein